MPWHSVARARGPSWLRRTWKNIDRSPEGKARESGPVRTPDPEGRPLPGDQVSKQRAAPSTDASLSLPRRFDPSCLHALAVPYLTPRATGKAGVGARTIVEPDLGHVSGTVSYARTPVHG